MSHDDGHPASRNSSGAGNVEDVHRDAQYQAQTQCQLDCQAAVIRVGEMFGEFGVTLSAPGHVSASALEDITQWNLCVYRVKDSNASSPAELPAYGSPFVGPEDLPEAARTFNETLPMVKPSKVVKLSAASQYSACVRVFNRRTATWSAWSPPVTTATLNRVVASIAEVGEDYARLQWDRAPRRTPGLAAEVDPDTTARVASIANFELRILREEDMEEVFLDRFDTGVRAYTQHDLQPGRAYVVLMRYETLIRSQTSWVEVGRFATADSLALTLLSRGEDTLAVGWSRRTTCGAQESKTVGYVLPTTSVHEYELTMQCAGVTTAPVRLPAEELQYRFDHLSPGTTFSVRVRALSDVGRWGLFSPVLTARTADPPVLSAAAVGETYLSVAWSRAHEEANETEVEYVVKDSASAYHQTAVVRLSSTESARNRAVHVESLKAGTPYEIAVRVLLDGEWGRWTPPLRVTTLPKPVLTFLERGERFVTVEWPCHNVLAAEGTEADKLSVTVTQVDSDVKPVVVLNDTIFRRPGEPGFRLDGLSPGSIYEVQCRVWQRNPLTQWEGWGELSLPIQTQTLRPVGLQIWDLGEDFVQLVWQRGLTAQGEVETKEWEGLKYEIVVGCVESGDDAILHCQVTENHYTISNLAPAMTYVISVRACDETEQWGLWSKTSVRTLAPLAASIHEIGEDFVRLMWLRGASDGHHELHQRGLQNEDDNVDKRQLSEFATVPRACVDIFTSKYSVFVYSKELHSSDVVPDPVSGYGGGGGHAEVAHREVVSSEHTSLRVTDLLPDREYVAVVRAQTASGHWGLWSTPVRFRTNPQLSIARDLLSVGENYVNVVWDRDDHPADVDHDVERGDLTMVSQHLCVRGVSSTFVKEQTLDPNLRELKVHGLLPACGYTIQLRVCGRSGCWGLWSPPVYIQTRGTMVTAATEVAEDYVVIAWERNEAPCPPHYCTGQAAVTAYHLRVYNATGIFSENFLTDGDCPYRIAGLKPDTYYCVELKTNYDDEEWGLWSTPLWCLTMQTMQVQTKLISEEFCALRISRAAQQRRLPEDDGNRPSEDKRVAFGQPRPVCMVCVTTPAVTPTPYGNSTFVKPTHSNSNFLPPDASNQRLIYKTELICSGLSAELTVPNLKSNTVYSVSVRSKLENGEWGLWSPSTLFATVPTMYIRFDDIGENYVQVQWKRNAQTIPPDMASPEAIQLGLGAISASRIRIREIGGSYQRMYTVQSAATALRLDSLSPTTTYGIAVQTFNDNYDWGVWSEESKVRTVPGMFIDVQYVSEDALWVSWYRITDLDAVYDVNTVLKVNIVAKSYEVCITDGHGFRYTKKLSSSKLFFRGLLPDTVYHVQVRVLFTETEEWGLWSVRAFRTQPRLRVTFGNVGEHFANVEWRRHLPKERAGSFRTAGGDAAQQLLCPPAPVTESEEVVQQFRFRVQRVGDPVSSVYNLSPNVSSFRLKDLQPSAEYVVSMCARGYEGLWGHWSAQSRVRTLPKLQLAVHDVGEDYVRVSWLRGEWEGPMLEDPTVAVHQVDGAVSGYQVRVLDAEGNTVTTQLTSYKECSCMVSELQLSTCYAVAVCAKDTYGEWGMWSDARLFETLCGVDMNVVEVGETFMGLEWARIPVGPYEAREESRLTQYSSAVPSGLGDVLRETQRSRSSSVVRHSRSMHYEGSAASAEKKREDDDVLQWHVRVRCTRLCASLPHSDDCREFFAEPTEEWRRIDELLPNATYVTSVRAKNKAGVWGNWSPPTTVKTYPLLQLKVEAIGETFVNLQWERPALDAGEHTAFYCFPVEAGAHNYQVTVEPLASEIPFDEEDEPLVDGARVYETTQPSLQLGNLSPGTCYNIKVREQHVGEDGKAVKNSWGSYSESCFAETVAPLTVIPVEIGEDYSLVKWRRQQRPTEVDTQLATASSLAKVAKYELRMLRIADDGVTPHEGAFSMDMTTALNAIADGYLMEGLLHNTIYSVQIRACDDNGLWGTWSAATKFVTQSRLVLIVQSVFETNINLSWARPQPWWKQAAHQSFVLTDERGDVETPSKKSQDLHQHARLHHPALEEVIIGDHRVQKYEVLVHGITCALECCLTLGEKELSTTVTDLDQAQIYSVSVRSLSEQDRWSMLSNTESVLTLSPVQVEVPHFTEEAAVIRWMRKAPDIDPFATLLARKRMDAERQCDERERLDLFDLKCRVQDLESKGESADDVVSQDIRRAQNRIRREEATHHLMAENVILGDGTISGYHLLLRGDVSGSTPFVSGAEQVSLHATPSRLRSTDSFTKRSVKAHENEGSVSSSPASAAATAADTISSSATPPAETERVRLEENFTSFTGEITQDESAALAPGCLIDIRLQGTVYEVVVKGLSPGAKFITAVRSRNSKNEWQPWSSPLTLQTLSMIRLDQSRFGEHYINLFWHRLPRAEAEERDHEIAHFYALNERYGHITAEELEVQKATLSDEALKELVGHLRELRDARQKVADRKLQLMDGRIRPLADPRTPIIGWQLRVVQESGKFEEHYIEESRGSDEACAAFTVTRLLPNHKYVCLLCPKYGEDLWGSWTTPLTFVTQNLLQLQPTYIGESFIDIEWERLTNRRLSSYDLMDINTIDTFSSAERVYQLSIEYKDPVSGTSVKEYRDIKASNVFRIDRLLPDTKYTIAVREWDAKGDWGLWCTPRTCVTLPGMHIRSGALGEDWMRVTWDRLGKRVDYDDDMHVLQFGVETVSYFLRVVELLDDDDSTVLESTWSRHSANVKKHHGVVPASPDAPRGGLDEMEGIFSTLVHREGPLPPQEHPAEFDDQDEAGRYVLVKHFDPSVTNFTLTNLKPNSFYSIQVLAETTGGQLGMWSSERYAQTMAKIALAASHIDEQYVDLVWDRPPPRQHPHLDMPEVLIGNYDMLSYELHATGANDLDISQTLPASARQFQLKNLSLDSMYTVVARSVNAEGEFSQWCDPLYVATLKAIIVYPRYITENSISLQWSRPAQSPQDYVADTTIAVQLGSCVSSEYHIHCVVISGESAEGSADPRNTATLFDKNIQGDVRQLAVSSLRPNTPYVFTVRAANVRGEWGRRSAERCVYTMKPLRAVVAAVGEDYFRVQWEREAPDELQWTETTAVTPSGTPTESRRNFSMASEIESVRASPLLPMASDGFGAQAGNAMSAFGEVVKTRSRRFPLLDRPPTQGPVYNSVFSTVRRYSISIRCASETEDYTTEVSGELTSMTIPNLRPDSVYFVSVRALYASNEWGPASETVQTGTYNLLGMEVKEIGEDFVSLTWQRKPNSADIHTLLLGTIEETVCYEISVYDFADVTYGEDASHSDFPSSRLQQVLFIQSKQRHCQVRELLSNHRYQLRVRRWYRPLSLFLSDCQPEQPATDDQLIREVIDREHAVPGAWSLAEFAVTLRDMVVAVEKISEDNFCVRWERDPRAVSLPMRKVFAPRPPQSYHIQIDELLPDGSAVKSDGTAYRVDEVLPVADATFMALKLQPDTLYRVTVRCCVEKAWGRWSAPVYIVTAPRLQLQVANIGEDTALVTWGRHFRQPRMPDGVLATIGDDSHNDKLQLEVSGVGFSFQLSKRLKGNRTSYVLKRLEANSVYSVTARSYDDFRHAFSLWSEALHFATLKPLQLTVGTAGEQFASLAWHRDAQSAEEYAHLAPGASAVALGQPDVIAYHLCIFDTRQTPSVAVVDKQFYRDTSHYTVRSLTPDTPYVAIARACGGEKGQWGLWSEEKTFRTERLLELRMTRVGERYITLTWERAGGGGGSDRLEAGAQPHKCLFLLRSDAGTTEHSVLTSACEFRADELKLPSYNLSGLTPGTQYVVALQPCYDEEGTDWGLWSNTVTFSTLNSLELNVTVQPNSAELSWARVAPPQLVMNDNLRQENTVQFADQAGGSSPTAMASLGPIVVSVRKYQLVVHRAADAASAAAEPDEVRTTSEDVYASTPSKRQKKIHDDLKDILPDFADVAGDLQSSLPDMEATHKLEDVQSSLRTTESPTIMREMKPNKVTESGRCVLGDAELQPDTVYVARVRALDVNNEWGDWAEIHFSTPPPAPTGLVLRKVNAQYCSLQWEPLHHHGHTYRYVVEQCYAPPDTSTFGASLPHKSASQTHLDWRVVDEVDSPVCPVRIAGTLARLRCRVKAARAATEADEVHPFSEYSVDVGLSGGTPPEPVRHLVLTELTHDSATLEWSAPPKSAEASGRPARTVYQVHLSTGKQPLTPHTTTHKPTCTLRDLNPSTAYTAQVVAENSDGVSYQNPSIAFTTKALGDFTTESYMRGQTVLDGDVTNPLEDIKRDREFASDLPEIPVGKTLGGQRYRGADATTSKPSRAASSKKLKEKNFFPSVTAHSPSGVASPADAVDVRATYPTVSRKKRAKHSNNRAVGLGAYDSDPKKTKQPSKSPSRAHTPRNSRGSSKGTKIKLPYGTAHTLFPSV